MYGGDFTQVGVCVITLLLHTDVSAANPHAGVCASLEIAPWLYVYVGGDRLLFVRRWRDYAFQ